MKKSVAKATAGTNKMAAMSQLWAPGEVHLGCAHIFCSIRQLPPQNGRAVIVLACDRVAAGGRPQQPAREQALAARSKRAPTRVKALPGPKRRPFRRRERDPNDDDDDVGDEDEDDENQSDEPAVVREPDDE